MSIVIQLEIWHMFLVSLAHQIRKVELRMHQMEAHALTPTYKEVCHIIVIDPCLIKTNLHKIFQS